MIEVRRTAEHDSLVFEVVVREGKGETRHHVTMSREMCERLTAGKHTPERCVEAAFRFLLDREPKESILGRFDVSGRCHVTFRSSDEYACRVFFLGRLPRMCAFGDGVLTSAPLCSCNHREEKWSS